MTQIHSPVKLNSSIILNNPVLSIILSSWQFSQDLQDRSFTKAKGNTSGSHLLLIETRFNRDSG